MATVIAQYLGLLTLADYAGEIAGIAIACLLIGGLLGFAIAKGKLRWNI